MGTIQCEMSRGDIMMSHCPYGPACPTSAANNSVKPWKICPNNQLVIQLYFDTTYTV